MSIASGPNVQYNIKIMVLHNAPTSVQHENNSHLLKTQCDKIYVWSEKVFDITEI